MFNAGTHTLTTEMAHRDDVALVKPVMGEFSVHLVSERSVPGISPRTAPDRSTGR